MAFRIGILITIASMERKQPLSPSTVDVILGASTFMVVVRYLLRTKYFPLGPGSCEGDLGRTADLLVCCLKGTSIG